MVGPTIFGAIGYNRWGIKNKDYSSTAIPIIGGVKYFFGIPGGLLSIYLGGGIGMAIVNSNEPLSNSKSKFIWSPSVGIRFSNIDINAKYQSFSIEGDRNSWFGLNVGIVIGR